MGKHDTLPALLADQPLVIGARRCHSEALDALLVWGCKPSGRKVQRLAERRQLPVWHCEDAFLRSLELGADTPPLGLVLDDSGIYYDASRVSRLECLIARAHSASEQFRAAQLQQLWCENRVSKYNAAPEVAPPAQPFVLVVDQTAADLSIAGAGASARSFEAMLAAALADHPDKTILVKIHPDVAAGRKQGHFVPRQLVDPRIVVDASGGHPTALLERAAAVYVVASQLGFEALLWGKSVHCFGMPFYAGWGLTHDAVPPPPRRAACGSRQLADLVHAALIDYALYLNPHTRQRCEVEELVQAIGLQRRRMTADPAAAVAVGFTRWKRPILRRFLPGSRIRFKRVIQPSIKPPTPPVTLLRWSLGQEALAQRWSGPVFQLEDGFLRSIGLGNRLQLLAVRILKQLGIRAYRPTRPISWVVDRQGIYFDATRPSDLESWLLTADPTDGQLARASALRQRLVEEAITKYNLTSSGWSRPTGARRVVLVTGQVESDASIRFGAVDVRTNLALLEAVRRAEPDAFLIYKPHPDVLTGIRRASRAERQAHQVADLVLREAAIQQLFSQVDAVHVLTSLAGFEALLRGVEVHTWGLPFYAGWGLTHDAHSSPRRGRQLSLDALVYGALIAYPRYVSRRSGWQITPEQAIDELLAWRQPLPEPERLLGRGKVAGV
ncbi:MAG: capsular polysaccharide biosynthesis protein [Cyanobacteria bacterium K_DeepCast_0m_m1_088]|nr:capsular polysaccharide biosynthesis protein [Cyanobacteria bacterium K_DeepCast_0m_m1_088]